MSDPGNLKRKSLNQNNEASPAKKTTIPVEPSLTVAPDIVIKIGDQEIELNSSAAGQWSGFFAGHVRKAASKPVDSEDGTLVTMDWSDVGDAEGLRTFLQVMQPMPDIRLSASNVDQCLHWAGYLLSPLALSNIDKFLAQDMLGESTGKMEKLSLSLKYFEKTQILGLKDSADWCKREILAVMDHPSKLTVKDWKDILAISENNEEIRQGLNSRAEGLCPNLTMEQVKECQENGSIAFVIVMNQDIKEEREKWIGAAKKTLSSLGYSKCNDIKESVRKRRVWVGLLEQSYLDDTLGEPPIKGLLRFS